MEPSDPVGDMKRAFREIMESFEQPVFAHNPKCRLVQIQEGAWGEALWTAPDLRDCTCIPVRVA